MVDEGTREPGNAAFSWVPGSLARVPGSLRSLVPWFPGSLVPWVPWWLLWCFFVSFPIRLFFFVSPCLFVCLCAFVCLCLRVCLCFVFAGLCVCVCFEALQPPTTTTTNNNHNKQQTTTNNNKQQQTITNKQSVTWKISDMRTLRNLGSKDTRRRAQNITKMRRNARFFIFRRSPRRPYARAIH